MTGRELIAWMQAQFERYNALDKPVEFFTPMDTYAVLDGTDIGLDPHRVAINLTDADNNDADDDYLERMGVIPTASPSPSPCGGCGVCGDDDDA